MIRKALPLLAVALFVSTVAGAYAQTEAPPTAFEKQMEKVDLSVQGAGIYNSTVSGKVIPLSDNQGQEITQFGSNTVGALVSIHYPATSYFGLEFNYGYARYTEHYEGPAISLHFLPTGTTDFQVQTKVNEYTFGYLITPPHPIFGAQPFASVGFGPAGVQADSAGRPGRAGKSAHDVLLFARVAERLWEAPGTARGIP